MSRLQFHLQCSHDARCLLCASTVAAVHRILAKTPWDVPLTLHRVTFLSPRVPQSVGDTVGDSAARRRRLCGTDPYIPPGISLTQGARLPFVLTGHMTWRPCGACVVLYYYNHEWTGVSTGGGGLLLFDV